MIEDSNLKNRIQDIANQIIADGYKSICFWMPCYNVSGGARYLRDLAVSIADNTRLKVYYMDFENGFPSQMLEGSDNVEIVRFDPEQTELPIKEPTVIFTNSTKVIQIKKMNPRSKMLFWHFETIPCAWDWLFFNGEEKKYIKLAKENKAMVYHDWSGKDILNDQFKIGFDNDDYLQVYSSLKTVGGARKEFNDKEINVVWLSRLGAEKVCSLYNIIDNFAKYKTDKIKRLHIIGDGIRRDAVEAYCKKYKERLEIIFTGTIAHEELGPYLLENADIVLAMGTSVVESAALGIPSAVVQLSSRRFSDDAFYWLFDAKDYCVGITTDEKERYNVQYKTLGQLLAAIDTDEKEAHIGEKCYNYFIENHCDFDSIVEKFLTCVRDTKLTYKDLKKAIRYTPYNIVEQVDYKIKGITLFSKTKFSDRLFVELLGCPIINYKLNDRRLTRWGVGRLMPIFKVFGRRRFEKPDNEGIEQREIKCFGKPLLVIKKQKKRTQYLLFGKKNILTKRENVGYTFPQSLFRG